MAMTRSSLGNLNSSSCRSEPSRRGGGRLGPWFGLAFLFVMAAAPRTSQALSGHSLVVLSISEAGRTQESLRARVSEFLKRTGAKLVDLPRLPAAERGCEESSCLNRLAEEHRARLILGARIERHGARERIIYMWLYDARSGRDQSERQVCDARDLQERLHDIAGKLVGPYLQDGEPVLPRPEESPTAAAEPPQAAAATPAPGPSAEPEPAAAPSAPLATARHIGPAPSAAPLLPMPPRHAARPAWRSRLAIGLGVVSLGALATAIALHAVTGRDAGMECRGQMGPCVLDYTPLFAPMYATAGALAVGTILTMTLPAKKEVH